MESLKITICVIILIGCLVGLCYAIKMLIRNERVYKFRMFIINNHYDLYHKLPPYQEMMHDGKPLKLESYI